MTERLASPEPKPDCVNVRDYLTNHIFIELF